VGRQRKEEGKKGERNGKERREGGKEGRREYRRVIGKEHAHSLLHYAAAAAPAVKQSRTQTEKAKHITDRHTTRTCALAPPLLSPPPSP